MSNFNRNGKEWRKWRYARHIPTSHEPVGTLDVVVAGDKIQASFTTADDKTKEWELNVALLGFGLSSYVKAGENAGRRLKQEFVVLNHVKETSADGRWNISMPSAKNLQAGRTGLAVWVNKKGSQTPLQATGGWL